MCKTQESASQSAFFCNSKLSFLTLVPISGKRCKRCGKDELFSDISNMKLQKQEAHLAVVVAIILYLGITVCCCGIWDMKYGGRDYCPPSHPLQMKSQLLILKLDWCIQSSSFINFSLSKNRVSAIFSFAVPFIAGSHWHSNVIFLTPMWCSIAESRYCLIMASKRGKNCTVRHNCPNH